jgi:hypothetical protein
MPRKEQLPRYSNLRISLEEAQRKAGFNPCIKGKAECCDRSVGLTRADATLLLRAFEEGQLPDNVRSRAYKNVLDRHNDRCPFLDGNNECGVYRFRPLICMAWGIGGRPKPEIGLGLALRKSRQAVTGEEQFVSTDEIVCYACQSCAEEIKRQNPTYSLSSIEAITGAYLYMHADDEMGILLTNFVKRRLKRSLKKK